MSCHPANVKIQSLSPIDSIEYNSYIKKILIIHGNAKEKELAFVIYLSLKHNL